VPDFEGAQMRGSGNTLAGLQRKQTLHGVLDLFRRKYRGQNTPNVRDKPVRHDVGRNARLKFAVADKHDHGMKEAVIQFKELGEALGMPIILPKWVLKLGFVSVNGLRPVVMIGVSKNPTLHIFGFDDENAISRNNHMIDLGGSIGRSDNHVVKTAIGSLTQPQPQSCRYDLLAQPSFDEIA
jgi:hypothetical protein